MLRTAEPSAESYQLAALIRRTVGWPIGDLQVQVKQGGLILQGHAYSALARVLAEVEAARLSGLPVVENRIELTERAADSRRASSSAVPVPARSGRSCGRASAG